MNQEAFEVYLSTFYLIAHEYYYYRLECIIMYITILDSIVKFHGAQKTFFVFQISI